MKRSLQTIVAILLFEVCAGSSTASLLPVTSIPSPTSGSSFTSFSIPKDAKRVYDLSFTLSNSGANPVAMFEITWLNVPIFTLGGREGFTPPFGLTQFELTLFSPPELDVGSGKPLDFFITPQFTLTNLSLEAVPESLPAAWLAMTAAGLFAVVARRRFVGRRNSR